MKLPRMTLEETVGKIVEEKGLSRKQVFDLIEKKKSTLSWMISDEGAADIVAKELGVETSPGFEGEDLSLAIGDLVAGMSNVTITGRIGRVKPPRDFVDKNGNKGHVANLTLVDKSGDLNVVLWGELAKLVEDSRVNVGRIIRIHNGYVREDVGGRAELHVGRRGNVEISPSDVKESDFPDKYSRTMKIRDLTAATTEADVVGTVKEVHGTKIVQTKDGRESKLSSLIIADETGEKVRVVFWNDKTSLMANIKNGDALEINSGKVRANRNGEVEVHINPYSTIRVNPPRTGNDTPLSEEACRGSNTTPVSQYSSEGLISEEPRFREFVRSNGEPGKILSFILSNGTSSIRVVAWGENAQQLRRLRKGDAIRIAKTSLKHGINGALEMHVTDAESLEVKNTSDGAIKTSGSPNNSPIHEQHTQDEIPRKKISELRDENTAEIKGIITRIQSRTPVYRACPKCFRKVSREGAKWVCPKDRGIVEPSLRVLYSLILDDGTGTIPCTLSGKVGEELLGMKASEMLPSLDDEACVSNSIFSNILGTEIILVGKCYTNRNRNMTEFRVQKIFRPDPKTEAKMLLEQIKNEFTN